MNITTAFAIAQWVYGYKKGEVYSGEVKSIAVSVGENNVTTITYRVGERITLSAESELAGSKSALTSQMNTAEDNANASTKATLSSAINALSES